MAGLVPMRAKLSLGSAANYSPPPCGEGKGRPSWVGVARGGTALPQPPDPPPQPSPTRGEGVAAARPQLNLAHMTNILSLVAEGGAGKSALVNEWLKRMQADNYRGAEAVLGWSFYSQGSKERATSAEPFLNWAVDKLGIKIDTTSATAKGEAIAEALTRRRVLLVLDGVEPLQHGLDSKTGEWKDAGLRALLRRFAAMPPSEARGLVVLTSRLAVKNIAHFNRSAPPVLDLEQLSDVAGAALLRDNGVRGVDTELQAAARAFGGHPLAL